MSRRRTSFLLALTLAAAWSFVAPAAHAAPPGNTTAATATVITALPYANTEDVSELAPTDEECGVPLLKSTWYRYEPTATVLVDALVTTQSDGLYHTNVVALYRDDGGSLSQLICQVTSGQDDVGFSAELTAGTSYLVRALGEDVSAAVTLDLTAVPAPANDAFASAAPVSLGGVLEGTTRGATSETDEPMACSTNPATVWFSFTPSSDVAVQLDIPDWGWRYGTTVYTGTWPDLTPLGCSITGFFAKAATTYYIQVGYAWGGSGGFSFRLAEAGPPDVWANVWPSDPSRYDTVHASAYCSDPIGQDVTRTWDPGDGSPAVEGSELSHVWAKDGDYELSFTCTTADGRSGMWRTTLKVRTHDVAIVGMTSPTTARAGQTKTFGISLRNSNYPEDASVVLYRSSPGGWVEVGRTRVTLTPKPRAKSSSVVMSYLFTLADAQIGKVSFRSVVELAGVRDALPNDNEFVTLPVKVTR